MSRVQAVTRTVGDHGREWVSAPGVRIDGSPARDPWWLGLMRVVFGDSSYLWIALVFALTLIR